MLWHTHSNVFNPAPAVYMAKLPPFIQAGVQLPRGNFSKPLPYFFTWDV